MWPFSNPSPAPATAAATGPGLMDSPATAERARKLSYPELADLVTAVQGLVSFLQVRVMAVSYDRQLVDTCLLSLAP